MHKPYTLLAPVGAILSSQLSRRLAWLGAGLIVGLLAGLGLLIRAPLEPGMTPIEGFYTPNVQYGPWFLANQQRLFAQSGELPVLSNYTAGLRYGATDYVNTFLTGAALILSGEHDLATISWLYQVTPWQGLLLVPLATVALYGMYARVSGKSVEPWPLVIIYALVAMPNYQMVNWAISGGYSLPIGWFIIYCVYLAILGRQQEEPHAWRWLIFLSVCLLILQPAYHTAALATTILVGSIWVLQRLLGMRPISAGLLMLAGVIFASFLMYHAVTLFNDYGRIFFRFLSDIYRGDDHERLRYMMRSSGLDPRLQALNALAIIVPPAWLVLDVAWQRRLPAHSLDGRYEMLWLLGLIPMAALLFAWDGFLGVYARLLQYGTLLSVACAVVLLLRHWRSRLVLSCCAAICIAVSAHSIVTARITTQIALTADEFEAAVWLRDHVGCEHTIFTDFRIGTTLGYQGCFAVVGPTAGSLSARNQIDRLADLLYAADPDRLAAGLDALTTMEGVRPDVILLSRRFVNARVGFVVPDMRLQPMTEAQWATYKTLAGWEVAFENNTALVLVRRPGQEY